MEFWRSSCGRYSVRLTDGFLDDAVRITRMHFPNEIGSPLSGEYSNDGTEARITGMAPVPADSTGSRFTFVRGVQGLRGFFSGLFRRSRGLTHYVGEWHSHPGGSPTPSATDDANMAAIARDPKARCPECVLVIIAVNHQHVAFGVYVYSSTRGRLTLRRLQPGSAQVE